MNTLSAFLILAIFGVVVGANAEAQSYRDIYSDTWVGTDALGRTMPTHEEVGPPKEDQRRVVGIFYITWHTQDKAAGTLPYTADVTEILNNAPEARLDAAHPAWGPASGAAFHFAEPEMGYFLSQDRYVIRKDMSMLADAGVDVLIMDVTNAVRYWDEWEVLFTEMQKMKEEGNKVPQFCFWAFNGPVITVVHDLYGRIYKEERFKDLWFYWDDKPLLLYNSNPAVSASTHPLPHPNPFLDPSAVSDPEHPNHDNPFYTEASFTDYAQDIKDFFTLRDMWWGYYEWAGERFIGTEGKWSFGYELGDERVRNMDPADLVAPWEGKPEQAAVTPAQHPSSLVGKSWSRAHGQPELNELDLPVPTEVPWLGKKVENPEGYGIYFQERWDEAIDADPQFLYINDWNEWTAGKYHRTDGDLSVAVPPEEERRKVNFLRRESDFMFIDQYNSEFNRGIHPAKGIYVDNYYMQMAQNLRRYKGARPIPVNRGSHTITVNGDFEEWNAITVEYRDTIGDTLHRDHPGYSGHHYTDDSGRNDIVTCKVAVDAENIFFYVATNETLTPHTGNNWMLLLINIDQNADTGWYGYDFLINKQIVDDSTTVLMAYEGDNAEGRWVEKTRLNYAYKGNALELAIPRALLGLDGSELTFDFKWADNPASLDDPLSLCTSGDTAPNRRFNYRFKWSM